MGYGSYTAHDWDKLKSSRKLSTNQSVKEVFRNTKCNPKYDPKYIGTRECFDSEDHPHTTPIVVGLDVTASMGYLATEVATSALNEFIMKLYSLGAVEDPALMCAAYGDFRDDSPLQVTQFESDIRIVEQLLDLYFENRGYGEVVPTCLWHFLSEHTNIDAIKKRGEKGFVFTIGDDAKIRNNDVPATINRVIGDPVNTRLSRESILDKVREKFNVYHIVIGTKMQDEEILSGHVMHISKSDIKAIPEMIISTIQLQKGNNKEAILEQWDPTVRPVVAAAVAQLCLDNDEGDINL